MHPPAIFDTVAYCLGKKSPIRFRINIEMKALSALQRRMANDILGTISEAA